MNSSREGEKLSKRLSTLASYHQNETIIWDIGCDHGHLGLSFSLHPLIEEIHLVDPSAAVFERLKENIKDSYITKHRVFLHLETGQKLKIIRNKNLFFIAGMGGEEIGEIIFSLHQQIDSSSSFVISPHRKILELRKLLAELPVSLIKEEVIFEDDQFYQVIAFRPGVNGRKVSHYGEDLWLGNIGAAYKEHQLKYFTPHRDMASQGYVSFLKTLTS